MEPLSSKPTTSHPIYDLTADDDDGDGDGTQRAYELSGIEGDDIDDDLQRACELSRIEYLTSSVNNLSFLGVNFLSWRDANVST
jgi:hypothetical protein